MSDQQPDSYTVWERLEPIARNYDLTETVRAEVHDPLWAMTRQWQLGEFEGHDGGSPVGVDLSYHADDVTDVEIAGTKRDYDSHSDGPLEAVVEREPVATDGPNHRLRLEAGMHFLDRLRRIGADENLGRPRLEEFDSSFRLDLSDEHLDADGRRFEHVVARDRGGEADVRALDGYAVYRAIDDQAFQVVDDSFDWQTATASDLPIPDSWSGIPGPYKTAAEGFHGWYGDLYDEPESAETDAWNDDRLEYEFAIETTNEGPPADDSNASTSGDDDPETVTGPTTRFEASEYTGGRLDWDDFTVTGGTDRTGPAPETISRTPTRLTFRGMPNPRYWAIEDDRVNFNDISAATEDVGWLTMIEIGLLAGTDWYMLPIEVQYGTLVRITDLSVTDTFGETTTVEAETPVEPTEHTDALDEKGWNTFLFDLPHRPEPGLLVPPVLGPAAQSDPVERVRFTRDEMANLVFAIENLVEGALGDPLDRAEFARPEVVVSDVVPSSDPDREYVELENPGDDSVDITGWHIDVEVADSVPSSFSFDDNSANAGGTLVAHTFGSVEIEPRSTVRLYTGGYPSQNTANERYIGADESLWARADSLTSYLLHTDAAQDSLVTEEPAGTVTPSPNPQYRLATDVPDHWFPFKARPEGTDDYRLALALLLDADTLGDTIDKIPKPIGEVLTTDADIFEEEITRQGTTVTRRYQLASGSDGRLHVWSGRNVSVGGGEESSGLQFDILEESEQ